MQPNSPFSPHGQGNAPYAQPAPYGQQPYGQAGPLYRANVAPPGVVAGPLVGPALRNSKLAMGIGQIVCLVAGIALLAIGAGTHEEVPIILGASAFGLWYLLFFAYTIVSIVWIYKFWSWLPPEERWSNMWKKYISPGTAVGFMFIPYFNLYWMFVVYLGIADAMERLRVRCPTTKPPVKNLALMTVIIPLVFFPLGPFFHYVFAKRLEEMAQEMAGRMGVAPA